MLPPVDRLKQLIASVSSVTVDPNIKVERYYRSGAIMVRAADMDYNNGHLEDAYKLYMKFSMLFIEQIPTHPDYKSVNETLKSQNFATQKSVLDKAERIKVKLKEKYMREYNLWEEQQKQLQRQHDEQVKLKEAQEREQQHLKPQEQIVVGPKLPAWEPGIKTDTNLSGVNYPNIDIISQPHSIGNNRLLPLDDQDNKLRTPTVDRSTKPVGVSGSHQSSDRLKTVVVPSLVSVKFQSAAHKATLNNVETCGILAGRLDCRDLVVTHVLVPKQHGTSNSCTAENEEEVFDYQDQNNLITLGWIHTHPSQTAFLSSVDLHTQCPYQLMMPEAIAIVCAPKFKETGIFCLTEYGLDFISKCRQTGFHPHSSDPPLFTEAGHVYLDSTREVQLIDLRK